MAKNNWLLAFISLITAILVLTFGKKIKIAETSGYTFIGGKNAALPNGLKFKHQQGNTYLFEKLSSKNVRELE